MTAFGLQMYDNKVEMHTDEEGSITSESKQICCLQALYRSRPETMGRIEPTINQLLPSAVAVNGKDTAPFLTEAEDFRKVYQDPSHGVTITVER